jgi:hypothetical protein
MLILNGETRMKYFIVQGTWIPAFAGMDNGVKIAPDLEK